MTILHSAVVVVTVHDGLQYANSLIEAATGATDGTRTR